MNAAAATNQSGAMETGNHVCFAKCKHFKTAMDDRDHFKNGASPKSLMSRMKLNYCIIKRNSIYLMQILVIMSILVGVDGCRARRPKQPPQPRPVPIASFVEGDGGWVSVLINKNIKYELAFDDVLSIVTRNFEIDMISPEAGYMRTKWNTTYIKMSNGAIRKDYRVRVTIKMSKERMKIDVNAEAERLVGEYWRKGYDTSLLETMRLDISGVVGM